MDAKLIKLKSDFKYVALMLQAAKARVEYCHNPSEGMAMYTYVISRLRKLACGCGCGSC